MPRELFYEQLDLGRAAYKEILLTDSPDTNWNDGARSTPTDLKKSTLFSTLILKNSTPGQPLSSRASLGAILLQALQCAPANSTTMSRSPPPTVLATSSLYAASSASCVSIRGGGVRCWLTSVISWCEQVEVIR
eukprot:CAMPEP_0119069408 /NCGR_PEP_ID=MMETSP1178-20130426/18178_1 /TAXON_ID=33656 /ORGANISM="unid sp, Strain CCMP2000" /LENGTH=133 /DNA_ID=CAMNT_0007051167 /DNA_START=301 /DNA_END=703 /DNA_ORIENTATION=+